MTKRETNLWQGIDPAAQDALTPRDYRTASFAQELAQRGVDAGELVAADKNQRGIKEAWIPGVEIFARKIHRADWPVAEAMVGCADVRAHGKRFPRASAECSGRQRCGEFVAPVVRR